MEMLSLGKVALKKLNFSPINLKIKHFRKTEHVVTKEECFEKLPKIFKYGKIWLFLTKPMSPFSFLSIRML